MTQNFSLVREEYLFGDQNLAARRLAKLHEIFAASSKAFITGLVSSPVQLAVDLGCGVGHTTEMLRRAVQAQTCLGLDQSEAFLERALSKYRRCEFVLADATAPLPVQGADVIYARYLLTHLPQPEAVLTRWLGALKPGGMLLVEENAAWETGVPAFQDYMQAVTDLMTGRGLNLFLGKSIAAYTPSSSFSVIRRQEAVVMASAQVAGELFAMNFPSWREQAVHLREAAWLDALAVRLQDCAAGGVEGEAKWTLCQLAVQRCG